MHHSADDFDKPDAVFSAVPLPPSSLSRLGGWWLYVLTFFQATWEGLSPQGRLKQQARAEKEREVWTQYWAQIGDALAAEGSKKEAHLHQFMQDNDGPWHG